MPITFYTIYEKLKRLNPAIYPAQAADIDIVAVKLLERGQKFFEESFLYIGKASSLPDTFPDNIHTNIICAADVPVPPCQRENPNINLIELSGSTDVFSLFNEVQEILDKQAQLDLFKEKLLNCVLQDSSIQYIIELAYEFFGNPIRITDTSFNLLAFIKDIEVDDPLWHDLAHYGYCTYDTVSSLISLRTIEQVHKSKAPVILTREYFKLRRMVGNIIIDKKIVGYLTLVESEREFNENDIELASLLCDVIALKLQKSNFNKNNKIFLFDSFIGSLLDGEIKDNSTIEKYMKYFELQLKENLYVITINSSEADTANTPIYYIRDMLENMLEDSKCAIYNNTIVILVSRGEKICKGSQYLENLTHFLKKSKTYAGISRCFHSILEMEKHYRQCLRAEYLGKRTDSENFLYFYEDYAVYDLLDINSRCDDLRDFCLSSIFSLIEYDKRNNSDYLRFLYTYIMKSKKKLDIAVSLNIHRNSINYRIKKIEKIMNVNLDNPRTIVHIFLSFKILKMLKLMEFD